ncbi:PLP-dependent aminotransferase family protein [Advenella sp. RU8]|uniref:aminotransferase-like domain-containing protein n=1 Tax=Advenella sp. RU8 TaxID=3399575 RepID=UPI003AB061FC
MSNAFTFAAPFKEIKGSPIRELFKYLSTPGMISFAGGYPAPELFDIEGLQASIAAQSATLQETMSYGSTEGLPALREILATLSTQRGIQATKDDILVTSGSQQAYELLVRALIAPGDTALVERPAYPAAIQGLRLAGANIVTVGVEEDGTNLDELAQALQQHRPKFFYCVPTFANPSGITLSLEKRKKLLALLATTNCLLIEDDPYGQLRFSGQALPTLAELARSTPAQDQVIYLSSLSKTVAPGLRIGWMITHPEILRRCVLAKQVDDMCSAPFMQAVAAHYLNSGRYARHLPYIIGTYRQRAQCMLDAFSTDFNGQLKLVRPEGGMFIWGYLPADINATRLLPLAIDEKVMFVPGSGFYADKPDENAFRLSFAMSNEAQITEGVTRFKKALDRY